MSMLDKVKANLGITGSYQDTTIQGYIDEVKEFLIDGGVSKEIVDDESSAGVITRGVADLWNYGSGGAKLSPYFKQRAIQLCYKSDSPSKENNYYTKKEIDEKLNLMGIIKNTFTYNSTEHQTEFRFDGKYDVIEVFVNHLRLNKDDYIISGNKIILVKDLTSNQKVEIVLINLDEKEEEISSYIINPIKDYFYEMCCDGIDYDHAYKYMKEKKPIIGGACSSVRNGNWYGRNLDWTYDENAEFLVRTPNIKGRYASIGIASAISGLTNDFVKSKVDSTLYKIVPFMLADGINEKGLVVNTNVVPKDKGITSRTVPAVSEEVEICSIMLVRYVLDHFKTAQEAAEYIRDHMAVYMPATLLDMNYETHFMIADENKTYLVEFIGNETVITEMDKPYMTNFYLEDVVFNQDGKVYTPASENHRASENNITSNGSGLERYNMIVENYDNSNTKDGMRELMNKLNYTNAYKSSTDPFWYTEFVGVNNLTVDSDISDYASVVAYCKGLFDNRTRNGSTWQTNHSVIYDIAQRKAYVIVQEDGKELEYSLGGV